MTNSSTVKSIFERHVDNGYTFGIVGLIGTIEDADVTVVGRRANDAQELLRRDSIFRIASMTKPIIAAATMMLVEDGTLRLDEPVDRLLPELANRRVLRRIDAPLDDTIAAKRSITVEDLLTFRCGLGIVLSPTDTYPIQQKIKELQLIGFGPPDPSSALTPDEWIKRLATLPLMAQPGEQWMYNTGSYVLGVLLARASGKALPQLLHERIFQPLCMRDTGFFVPPGKLARLVDLYRLKSDGLERYDAAADSLWKLAPAFPDGAAGLVSTVDDYFAFSRFMLGGGRFDGLRLLSEASISAMTMDRLTPQQRDAGVAILGHGRGWGFGESVVVAESGDGLPIGSYGWNGGLGTSWVADPRSRRTAILLTQTMFTSPKAPEVHTEFWRAVFFAPG
jgi:CubicO group peptidase (beta-lactamase class C family)